MSSPERYTLRLSRQAERDIESILQYTYETYGERQRQRYADVLHAALETITDNPGLGPDGPTFPSGIWRFTSSIILWYTQCLATP
jgi:plasmid stabilization system protein ParE